MRRERRDRYEGRDGLGPMSECCVHEPFSLTARSRRCHAVCCLSQLTAEAASKVTR